MKIINKILYVEWQEMVEAGIPESTLKDAKQFERPSWSFIQDPADARKVLVEYESLKDRYKELIKRKFEGDPYKFQYYEIIRKHAANRPEDFSALVDYRLPDERSLSAEKKDEYLTALKFINLYNYVQKEEAVKLGFANRSEFVKFLLQVVVQDKVKLPSSLVKFTIKAKQVRENGPTAIISAKFCNTNRLKTTEEQRDLILMMRARANQFNNEQIKDQYNVVAQEKEWEPVSRDTVRRIVTAGDVLIKSLREGRKEWHDKYNFIVERQRPEALSLWVGDGTPYELYYQREVIKNGKKVIDYYARKTVYIVIDALNDYIVGYSIADGENIEMTKLAWKDALVKAGYMPRQIKVDNFGKKQLGDFFQRVGLHFTPAAVMNARDKVVEQVFSKIRNQETRKEFNYSGPNIRANEQTNPDHLAAVRKDLPNEEQVIEQIHAHISNWNKSVEKKTGKPRCAAFIESIEKSDKQRLRPFDNISRLMLFGVQHKHTVKLSSRGLTPTLLGENKTYMLFNTDWYLKHVGTPFHITYDPQDTSVVMAHNKDLTVRYELPEVQPLPMAFEDMKEGDRIRLNRTLEFKKKTICNIATAAEKMMGSVRKLEAESYLKTGMLEKGTLALHQNQLKQLNYTDEEEVEYVPLKNDEDDKDIWDL
jgi:hypothetical protein